MSTVLIVLVMAAIVLPAVGLVAYVALSGHDFGRAQHTPTARHISDMAMRVARASGVAKADRTLQHQD